MNVWIVNPYGTLPSEGWREYRSSMLARAFAEGGHQVTWWISNFEHRSKTFRPEGALLDPALSDSVKIISLPVSSYKKNISIARVKCEIIFGRKFAIAAEFNLKPDAIVLADPSLFYSTPVLRYAAKVGAKVVLDVLDLWPEQFQVVLPKFLRPLGRFLFLPLYIKRQRVVDKAHGIVAVTKDHLKAVNPRKDKPCIVAYLGLDYKKFVADSDRDTPTYVQDFVLGADLVIAYAGTLGESYDLASVLEAAQKVVVLNSKVKFIFAGDGTYKNELESLAKRLPNNVLYVGKIFPEELPALYRHCHVGICSYSKDSTVTMPVKLYDYLAGGLFVIYSINGEIDDVFNTSYCGRKYAPEKPNELSNLILDLARDERVTQRLFESSELAKTLDQNFQHKKIVQFVTSIIDVEMKEK